jgi:ABC-type nitrate/sulfonate/bicarbonate transport system ATPase subunit
MQNYQITDTVLLDIAIDSFEYQPGVPILSNIHQKIYDIVLPGVQQGQIVAILGPSGIGKSTLFELISGLRPPTKGNIRVYDSNKNELVDVKTGMVGKVYQSYELFPYLTVKAQLALGAEKGGLKGQEAEDRIQFHLDHFRLRDHVRKYPNELSGGQRQRLAIAQQLLCSNMVLLMDEPFSGLDPLIKDEICELIADISKLDEMKTILIVSHDIKSALAISDTIWLLGKKPDGSASIVETIDMMRLGYCWRSDIAEDQGFQKLVSDVSKKFKELSGPV